MSEEIIRFKAGDDVPEYIERIAEDSDPIEHIRFGVDVVVKKRDDGVYEVHPERELPPDAIMMRAKAKNPDSFASIVGGPTEWYSDPWSCINKH
jgi:hypothetical protein